MQYFLASDVLYKQAQGQIDAELQNQGINEKAPASVFMADPTRWLDPLQVIDRARRRSRAVLRRQRHPRPRARRDDCQAGRRQR